MRYLILRLHTAHLFELFFNWVKQGEQYLCPHFVIDKKLIS
eukprot:SAG11_NODE_1041_length_6056_cov_5.902468_9_plen_40_part_01